MKKFVVGALTSLVMASCLNHCPEKPRSENLDQTKCSIFVQGKGKISFMDYNLDGNIDTVILPSYDPQLKDSIKLSDGRQEVFLNSEMQWKAIGFCEGMGGTFITIKDHLYISQGIISYEERKKKILE